MGKIQGMFALLLVSISTVCAQHQSAEQVYVQTDKGIYETGEDLWFKSYVLDRSSLSLSGGGSTLFVEMLDKKDSIVWQEKYPVQAGIVDGHIYIDKELNPGDYRIHAYTRFSFLDDTIRPFYPKKIRIVKTIANKGYDSSVPPDTRVAKLTFFPEGGNLIEGIPAKVAFKALNEKGMPVAVDGVLQENGQTVARLESVHDGMGNFMLRPRQGAVYQAVLSDGTTFAFPDVASSGLSLFLRKQTDEYVEFYISQPKGTVAQKIHLAGKMRGSLCCTAEGMLRESLKVRIPLKEFPQQGIVEFTLYNESMQPMAERLVYLHPQRKLHIRLWPDKERYKTREKGKLSIQVCSENGKPVQAHLGLSLFDVAYKNESVPENMLSYCFLSTEIKGNIHNPAYYFDEENKDRLQALDLLLLTQGWRRYVWDKDCTSVSLPFLSDEIQGWQVIGKKKKQQEVGNNSQLLQISGPNADSRFIMTDSSGRFTIPTEQMVALRGGYMYVKPMLDKDEYKPEVFFDGDFARADSLRRYCKSYQACQDIALLHSDRLPMENLVVSQDSSILLSEVTVTGTKGRVFRDKMMGRLDSLAKVDLNKAWVCKCHPMYLNDYLNGYTHHPKGNYEGERLKPVVGQSYRLIKYSPVGVVEDIQESLNYQGVLYSDEELLKMNNLYRVKGYYGKREFYQPDELEMQSPIPDVRNVLFWKSDIITDEQGKAEVEFFCSDINTGFVGVIEGTDGVGNIGSSGCEFRVMKY
ncbi:hypothetical protein [uncultured Parabacteroides sp.]|uniref:hypothetical protein n=1 Tax=uncultured Parabacteroides sp. TaxID=512312 RepID=UPI002803FFA6|nr:hypothetical protein [uncultured Parabacteroides sp.]